MRHINKTEEPTEFTNWKIGGEEDWNPGWGDFDGKPIKQTVKRALLAEQGYLCCYCEIRVDERNGHIEHIKPRHSHPESALKYDNILYSCKETAKRVPATCGHARKPDDPVPVSPLEPNCEFRFIYTEIGEILPRNKTDHEAAETIRILNLNVPNLCRRRAEIYSEVETSRELLSEDDFRTWTAMELQRDKYDMLKPFWGTKKYMAGRKA